MVFKNLDWDNVFAYNTFKMVRIRDRRLGLLFLFFVTLAVVAFMYQLFSKRGFCSHEAIEGTPYLHLENPGSNPRDPDRSFPMPSYCGDCNDPYKEHICNCSFYDSTIIAGLQDTISEYFIPLAIQEVNQTRNNVDSYIDPITKDVTLWNTYSTINETGWRYLPHPEEFVLVVLHQGVIESSLEGVPSFKLTGELIDGATRNTVLTFPAQPDNTTDRLTLRDILEAANRFPLPVDFPRTDDEMSDYMGYCRAHGCELRLMITYGNCRYMRGGFQLFSRDPACTCSLTRTDYYRYSAQLADMGQGEIRRVMSRSLHFRQTWRMYGILVVGILSGTNFAVDPNAILVTCMSSMMYVFVALLVVNIVALAAMGMKRHYRAAQFQSTESFRDIRAGFDEARERRNDRPNQYHQTVMMSLSEHAKSAGALGGPYQGERQRLIDAQEL